MTKINRYLHLTLMWDKVYSTKSSVFVPWAPKNQAVIHLWSATMKFDTLLHSKKAAAITSLSFQIMIIILLIIIKVLILFNGMATILKGKKKKKKWPYCRLTLKLKYLLIYTSVNLTCFNDPPDCLSIARAISTGDHSRCQVSMMPFPVAHTQ